jgi:hypothetical protein
MQDQLYARLCPKLKETKFATMSDLEALLAIQSEMVWIRVWLDTADVITHASTSGYYANIQDVASLPAAGLGQQESECRKHAINILKFVESPKTKQIDMDSQAVIGMKTAMVGCGFATANQVASLDALASKQVTWCESEGLPAIDLGHIVSAREINNGIA